MNWTYVVAQWYAWECRSYRRRGFHLIPSQEDPLEKAVAAHSSILAWKFSWTEEPGGLQSMGLQKNGTQLSTHSVYLTLLPMARPKTTLHWQNFLKKHRNKVFIFGTVRYCELWKWQEDTLKKKKEKLFKYLLSPSFPWMCLLDQSKWSVIYISVPDSSCGAQNPALLGERVNMNEWKKT